MGSQPSLVLWQASRRPPPTAANVLLPQCDLFNAVAQAGCCYFCLCCWAQRFLQKCRTCQLLTAPYKVYVLFLRFFFLSSVLDEVRAWLNGTDQGKLKIVSPTSRCSDRSPTPGNHFGGVSDSLPCSQPASSLCSILREGWWVASSWHTRPLVPVFWLLWLHIPEQLHTWAPTLSLQL